MTFRPRRLSIRLQILLMAGAILLPLSALLAWLLVSNLRQVHTEAMAKVGILATETSARIERELQYAEGALGRLASRPQVKALDPRQCDPVLKEFTQLNPEFNAVMVRDLQGKLLCSTVHGAAIPNAGQMPSWFQEASRQDSFFVSDAFVGLQSKRWSSALTYPIRDETGAVKGILILPLDLLRFNDFIFRTTPKNAVTAVFDRKRAFLLRSRDPEAYIGKPLNPELAAKGEGRSEGYLVTPAADGELRLVSFMTIPGTEWIVAAGLPEAEVFADYEATRRLTLGIGLGVLLLALALAWRIGGAIARPVAGLARTAARIATGEKSARAPLAGPAEMELVAQHFNQMLDARDDNEARLGDFARASGDWFFETDAEHRYLTFSGRPDLMAGHPPAFFIGKTRMEAAQACGVDLEAEPWKSHLGTLARHEPFRDIVSRFRTPTGEYWLNSSGSPSFDGSGRFIGYRVVKKDITHQVQEEQRTRAREQLMQATLLESAQSFRELVELSPEPIGVHLHGKMLYVNPAAVKLFGARTKDELIGKTTAELIHPDLHAASRTHHQRLIAMGLGASLTIQERFLKLDGTPLDVIVQDKLIRWNGEVATLVLAHDISDQERERKAREIRAADLSERLATSEKELRESERRFAIAVEATNLGIWVRDLEHDRTWASDNLRGLLGLTPSESVDGDAVLERIHPEDRSAVVRQLRAALNGSSAGESEFRIEQPGARQRWVTAIWRIEFSADRKPVFIRAVLLDSTARKQAELDIRQKQREVAHLSRVTMLGALSGSLAHELNQPLTSILSNAQAAQRFLSRKPVDLEELRAIMQDIVDEDKRAGEVIRRLRRLLSTGETQLQAVPVNELVSEVIKLLHSDLVNQGVQIVRDLAPDLPHVVADQVQIQQVLINLVMNAVDAMQGAPRAERRLIVRTGLADSGHVMVSVIDNGSGIAPEHLERLFEPFYTSKAQGMGLGLSICRTLVGACGGRLWGVNNPGEGATFQFTLPIKSSS